MPHGLTDTHHDSAVVEINYAHGHGSGRALFGCFQLESCLRSHRFQQVVLDYLHHCSLCVPWLDVLPACCGEDNGNGHVPLLLEGPAQWAIRAVAFFHLDGGPCTLGS